MNIVEESEALSVKLTALDTSNEHLALRMLRLFLFLFMLPLCMVLIMRLVFINRYSRDHYEAAVCASTDDANTLYRLADVLKELAIRFS